MVYLLRFRFCYRVFNSVFLCYLISDKSQQRLRAILTIGVVRDPSHLDFSLRSVEIQELIVTRDSLCHSQSGEVRMRFRAISTIRVVVILAISTLLQSRLLSSLMWGYDGFIHAMCYVWNGFTGIRVHSYLTSDRGTWYLSRVWIYKRILTINFFLFLFNQPEINKRVDFVSIKSVNSIYSGLRVNNYKETSYFICLLFSFE